MNELKPCPFCGGEAELFYGPGLGTDSCRGYTLYASCNECGAKSPGLWQEKKPEPNDQNWKDAADEWNWRPGEEELKQLWSSNLDIINKELNRQLAEARAEIERLKCCGNCEYCNHKIEACEHPDNEPEDIMKGRCEHWRHDAEAAKGEV